ncbi:hypothetical protein [Candidatus Anaplasma sp. TIGMIC]|uniref:hypothetical protein n=1 Tax=Candidatus Anaplasma sp. TIGMIC TaxID=3020713 RepID=UPI00232F1DB5|nr:hypothetical protein [Candidatus Anaplasma sp. TIGMIC]MDB1135394.1 hypothetical protein [Candidatus Anaplasma sp. TIGMIC]
MHGNNVRHDTYDDGFAPWEQWSPEADVCFHDRIAKKIKNNTLSVDKIASIVLKLLTKANEIALALLKEVRYVDSPWASTVDTHALFSAQHHISDACSLLKVCSTEFPGETIGRRMLRTYDRITGICNVAMLLLSAFYSDFDMWLNGHDEKSEHVAQMLVMISNAVDAMQQCRVNIYPDEFVTRGDGKLSDALGTGEKLIKIVIHSLNAVRIPEKDGRVMATEKNALLTNASLLISSFKLLNIAANRNPSVRDITLCRVRYEHVRAIRFYCYFRALVLRIKIQEYMTETTNSFLFQILSTIEWALGRLDEVIYSISQKTYENVSEDLHNAYNISLNVTECATILTLLHMAYERAGKKNSTTSRMLRINVALAHTTSVVYVPLECISDEAVLYVEKQLHNVMKNLASIHQGLECISRYKLLYPLWSAELLQQARQAVDTALTVCEAELKRVRAQVTNTACSEDPNSELTALCTEALGAYEDIDAEVSDVVRHVHFRVRGLLRCNALRSNTWPANSLLEGGGGDVQEQTTSGSVTTPSGHLGEVANAQDYVRSSLSCNRV